ncbi:MAG TPA: TrbC/VirB2 family protein [Candidatus Ratteibacteria bacterium]|nr:TrbC/VirB2 family protein [Candidatus Ratteibacteria bacterium]
MKAREIKERIDMGSWKALNFVLRNSKKIALVLVVVGVVLFTYNAFAASGVEGEITNFAETLRNILVGPVAKTLAVGCFIGAGIFFMLGKMGLAIGCIVGGIFLGFAEKIAESVFR